MSIGGLARRSGLPASTIRYYEKIGLLPAPRRASGRRIYDDQIFDRLLVVTFAKEAGFSLGEIRQLFTGFPSGTSAALRWQELAKSKLVEVEAKAARIEAMKQLLREALRCRCIDLDVCGQLLRERVNSSGAPQPGSKIPKRERSVSGGGA